MTRGQGHGENMGSVWEDGVLRKRRRGNGRRKSNWGRERGGMCLTAW